MANGYSAGDLNLTIQTIANDTLKSLDAVIERLKYINNGLTKIGGITSSFNRSTGRTSGNEKKFVTDSTGKRYLALEKNVISVNNAIEKTTSKFNSQNEQISKTITKIDEYGNKLTEVFNFKKNKTGLLDLGKWTAVLYVARKVGRITADIVQSGADYAETLNLWQVAMNDYTDKATVFVNKMNEAYGISEKTLMNAQATFKNMLGALGNITDDMAYQLSESVTRMAIDYASLYNVGIEESMTKFQAALAGQVRPIRSVSGYDITENTLYQLYQSIGGTKTIRQLSQTEKRLLAIYAIFQQMEASGAINDMERTINSFANQSRIMAESWNEVSSYAGLILTQTFNSLNILQGINTLLAFTAEFLKGIATVMGAVKGEGSGIFGGVEQGADDASKAIDEVQGKLLGFDKIRALNSSEDSTDVSIDNALANAMAEYNSGLGQSTLKAKENARIWLETIGLIYDAETGTYEISDKFEGLANAIKLISSLLVGVLTVLGSKGIMSIVGKLTTKFGGLGASIGKAFDIKSIGIMALVGALYYLYTTNEEFKQSIDNLLGAIINLIVSAGEPLVAILSVLGNLITSILDIIAPVLTWLVDIITNTIEFIDSLGLLEGAVWLVIGAFTAFKALELTATIALWISDMGGLVSVLAKVKNGITSILTPANILIAGITMLVTGIGNFIHAWDDMGNIQKAIGIISALAGAITAVVVGIHLASPAGWVKAIGIGSLVAGSGLLVSSQLSNIGKFAEGGLPDKGTMFVAGEAGAEIVYNTPSGQSGVANVRQIAQANYAGTTQALNDWWARARGDIPQFAPASDSGLYERVTAQAGLRGDHWSN